MKSIIIFAVILYFSPCLAIAQSIEAFAGAEGAGALSQGGRGGRVIQVTNLKDAGAGSLRAAIDASGPRIVVFRVGGTIELASTLRIKNPFITIAGHTAPGGGVLINGKSVTGATMVINSHDVIVRYLRVRNGAGGGTEEDDAIGIHGGYKIIVDHCSVSWSTDENLSTWAWEHEEWSEPKNISWSYNLVAEGILDHSKAMLTGASSRAEADNMTNIDIHHNMFIHHYDRNPFLKHKSGRVVNNIAYNWSGYALATDGGVHLDIIGNLFVEGPNYNAKNSVMVISLSGRKDAASFSEDSCPMNCPRLFVADNVTPDNQTTNIDPWEVLSADWNSLTPVNLNYRRTSPLPYQSFPISILTASELEAHMVNIVGASRRLDEFGDLVPNRDFVDLRLIEDFINRTGEVIADEAQVKGLQKIASGDPYPDSDRDGMSDLWEVGVGLSPKDSNDGNRDRNNDGVSNIEEFLDGNRPRS